MPGMGMHGLFGGGTIRRSTITEHLKNIFETGELNERSVCRDFRHTAEDGKDYTKRFYNLDAIIGLQTPTARRHDAGARPGLRECSFRRVEKGRAAT